MEKVAGSIKNLRVDAAKIKGFGLKILKAIGWLLLLYIMAVVCFHISNFPLDAYRFCNGTWGEPMDDGVRAITAVFLQNVHYFSLSLSGLIIFFCKKKSLDRMEKAVKIRKFPLFASAFFAMPFSFVILDFVVGLFQRINILYYLHIFIAEVQYNLYGLSLYGLSKPSNLLEFYISRITYYWCAESLVDYMITIFCTYYVIKQLYLYYRQTQIYTTCAK